MALILSIDTSTKSTSVALAQNEKLLAFAEEHEVVSHAEKLSSFIENVLNDVKVKPTDLDAIAIAIGPGSYTGLRIGLSTAKGLCYTLGIPLITISSLSSVAYALCQKHKEEYEIYVSIMNSRKNEIYCELLDSSYTTIQEAKAVEIDTEFLSKYKNKRLIIAGTGMEKLIEVRSNNIFYDKKITFSAKNMLKLAYSFYKRCIFADVAYVEPNYLKPFITTK